MRWSLNRRGLQAGVAAVLMVLSTASAVFAETSSSNNYQMVESDFTAGGSAESCSTEFCSRVSIGDVSAGSTSNTVSTAEFGSVTPDEPSLEVIVDAGESNLGNLTTEQTASKTTTVRIRSYLSNGYTLQINGDPPKYSSHTLAAPGSPTAASPGTEQFALNAVANTSPSVGANPQQVPSSETSFGTVDPAYAIPNMFKYTPGEVIARSDRESGRTDFTISMIVNIANSTPAGRYFGDYSAVVVPVY